RTGLGGEELDLEPGNLRLIILDGDFIRSRVNLEQHVAFLDRAVWFDGHLGDQAAHRRIDRDYIVDHPDVMRRGRDDIEQENQRGQADDRERDDNDLADNVPREPFELEKDQPDEKRID